MFYLGVIVLILFFAVTGIVGHGMTESEKWFRIFKERGRDDE